MRVTHAARILGAGHKLVTQHCTLRLVLPELVDLGLQPTGIQIVHILGIVTVVYTMEL